MSDEYFEEFGRRLCAASVSVRLGIGLQYALKRHCAGPVGEFWISLAKGIHEIEQKKVMALFPVPTSTRTQ